MPGETHVKRNTCEKTRKYNKFEIRQELKKKKEDK